MKDILNQKIEEVIEKADVAPAFQYNDALKFTKKGSLIKEAAEKRLVEYSAMLKETAEKMSVLRSLINEEPNEKSYVNEDTLKICTFCSKRYGNIYNSAQNEAIPMGTINGVEEIKNSKIKYNDLIQDCDNQCRDIVALKTIINNIEVGKEYVLNFNQVKSLNF